MRSNEELSGKAFVVGGRLVPFECDRYGVCMSPANLFIMGAPRSGTSMTAGLFSGGAFHQGDHFRPADDRNPHGYFEADEITFLNEELLKPLVRRLPMPVWEFLERPGLRSALKPLFPWVTPYGKRFLSHLPEYASIPEPEAALELRMRECVSHTPFCYKDPRFSYTFVRWRQLASNCRFLCLVRDPYVTTASMIRFGWPFSVRAALKTWFCMYRFILANREEEDPNWMFAHYEQVLSGEVHEKLEAFADAPVDAGFVDPGANRSRAAKGFRDAAVDRLYEELCALANYQN